MSAAGSQELCGGLAGGFGVLDEVAGVEDFDEGLGGGGGGLAALVFGSRLCDAVELGEGVLGVGVVVPGDELGEGEVVACGDLWRWVACREVILEKLGEDFGGDEVWGWWGGVFEWLGVATDERTTLLRRRIGIVARDVVRGVGATVEGAPGVHD